MSQSATGSVRIYGSYFVESPRHMSVKLERTSFMLILSTAHHWTACGYQALIYGSSLGGRTEYWLSSRSLESHWSGKKMSRQNEPSTVVKWNESHSGEGCPSQLPEAITIKTKPAILATEKGQDQRIIDAAITEDCHVFVSIIKL